MAEKKRGRAIIIVNRDFPLKKDERKGATRDLDMMKALFNLLDFEVKAYTNLTGDKMRAKLEKAKEWKHEYQPSCFVCVISSHGEELKNVKTSTWHPSVFGVGGDADKVYINDITTMFADTNCETYSGKPKLFFIQACRSSDARGNLKYDGGISMKLAKEEGMNIKTDEKGDNTVIPHSESADDSLSKTKSPDSAQYQKQSSTHDNQDLSDGEWDGTLSEDENEAADAGKGDASDCKGRQEPGQSSTSDVKFDVQESPMLGLPKDIDDKAGVQESFTPEPPKDMADVNCPKNCLLMFPVTSGRAGLRPIDGSGSWMIQFMNECKNAIVKTGKLMNFVTSVSHKMANRDFSPLELSEKTKCTTVTVHRLTTEVIFEPISETSSMGKRRKELEEEDATQTS